MDIVFFTDIKAVSLAAKKLGQKEVVLAKRFLAKKELLELSQEAKKLKLKVKFCHLLENVEEKVDGGIDSLAEYYGFVGGTMQSNKNAVSSKRIDFLFRPVSTQKLEFDSAMANNARENGVGIVVLFEDFLNASQRDLVSFFRNNFLLAKICQKSGAKFFVYSGAKKSEEMRSEKDLETFLALLEQQTLLEEEAGDD